MEVKLNELVPPDGENDEESQSQSATTTFEPPPVEVELSTIVITLLKRVIYRENDSDLWTGLVKLQAKVREYVAILLLELIMDEAEGYAFLRSRVRSSEDDMQTPLPRLISRRALSFPVSLLLALLRKKLAEFDARGGETRLILTRAEIVELMRVFLPQGSNEARLVNQLGTHINKIVELGFLRPLNSRSNNDDSFEVRRILKAFVDAQWLEGLEARLEVYRAHMAGSQGESGGDD